MDELTVSGAGKGTIDHELLIYKVLRHLLMEGPYPAEHAQEALEYVDLEEGADLSDFELNEVRYLRDVVERVVRETQKARRIR